MKKACAVIGANFGDEGKGLITDFLSEIRNSDSIVVRQNGGAQAGHTVTTPDGKRHIFSHFGSGSFVEAETFLSQFFVSSPLLFVKEYALLEKLSLTPYVSVDDKSPVTTPYEMMINQIIEESRGHSRHGSCGLGFGETIERQEKGPSLVYADLFNIDSLEEKLKTIREKWLPERLSVLGIDKIPDVWRDRIFSEDVLGKFIEDTEFFLEKTNRVSTDFLADTDKEIIFEGAQGLLLDQVRGYFPHVTRSHTGIKNIETLVKQARIDELDVHYITRAYMTRHGAGPLSHELEEKPYAGIVDKTNITNTYQGSLRFGWLNIDLLKKTIEDDLSDHKASFQLNAGLVVTCLDQVDEEMQFIKEGVLCSDSKENFLKILKNNLSPSFLLKSTGPSRNFISKIY